jgi:hypothetical protein
MSVIGALVASPRSTAGEPVRARSPAAGSANSWRRRRERRSVVAVCARRRQGLSLLSIRIGRQRVVVELTVHDAQIRSRLFGRMPSKTLLRALPAGTVRC